MARQCIRYVYLATSLVFWLLSVTVVFFMTWLLVAKPSSSHFLYGHEAVTYLLVISGIITFICGFIGCLAAVRLNKSLVKSFIVGVSCSLVVQLGLFMYLIIRGSQVSSLNSKSWTDSGSDLQNQIQSELQCCGFSDPLSEYDQGNGTITLDISCYETTQINDTLYFTPYEVTCKQQLSESSTSFILLTSTVLAGLITAICVIGIISAGFILSRFRDREESPSDDVTAQHRARRKYRFIRGPMTIGKQYSGLE